MTAIECGTGDHTRSTNHLSYFVNGDRRRTWKRLALPLQFMTRKNTVVIGNLFHKLLRYESATIKNIIGTKYIRMQVEVNVRKPLPVGFFHNMDKVGRWISF